MENIEYWMQQALAEASSCGDDVPVGCVILKGDQLLARGRNQREATADPCGHAEIVAMRAAAKVLGTWRLDGTTLICTLEPCPMCAEAIIQSRVSQLIYGAADLAYGAVGSAFNLFAKGRTFPLPQVTGGVKEEESRLLLKQFFQRQRALKG